MGAPSPAGFPREVSDYLLRWAESAWLADQHPRVRAIAACVNDEHAGLRLNPALSAPSPRHES